MSKLWLVAVLLCAAMLGAVAQLFFKKSGAGVGLQMLTNWVLIAGIALYGVAFLINIYAYKYGDVTLVYPVLASTHIFAFVLAAVFLGEHVTLAKVTGIIAVAGGIGLIWSGL